MKKSKTFLRDFVVTVGLLAMTLLSFMSKRVVPMGTSWYLPYCASVGVGIMSLLCVVLLWDSIKAGKNESVACGHCGAQISCHRYPVYLRHFGTRTEPSRVIEMDLFLCRACYRALKRLQLRAVWIGLACCIVPRCMLLVFSATRWGESVVPVTPLLNLGIALAAYLTSGGVWILRTESFQKQDPLVQHQIALGGKLGGYRCAEREDGKVPYESAEWLPYYVNVLFGLVLGTMTVLPGGFANPPCW